MKVKLVDHKEEHRNVLVLTKEELMKERYIGVQCKGTKTRKMFVSDGHSVCFWYSPDSGVSCQRFLPGLFKATTPRITMEALLAEGEDIHVFTCLQDLYTWLSDSTMELI